MEKIAAINEAKVSSPIALPGHCNFFVVRKKRYCRMLVKELEHFCCEHQLSDANEKEGNTRIPCPLDSKHSCYAHKLNKHLRICNARPKQLESYIVKGINSGCYLETDLENHGENRTATLSSTSNSEILRVIDLINKVYDGLQIEIIDKISSHQIVENEMNNPVYGEKTKKHLKQASSVLGLLSEYDMFHPYTCFVEFGAGRGALSYWICKATSSENNILLVEKASPKHKKDNKLDKSSVRRIRADITDLVLDEVDVINESKYIVGVTKHLCGAATDLTLRCLTNLSKNKHKLIGFIMTFCCHHRCTWSSFIGKKYFLELGLQENDFLIMCGIVSWATCGTGFSRERRQQFADSGGIELELANPLGLSAKEKTDIGWKCKNLINWARMKFVQDVGFESSLCYYVKPDVTPENVCIIAKKKNI
ncbi:hypothetical protein HHI36_011278 [Cryptolaemus montrouzieri]|uniref:tRNA:m(4)X modification enzyme TRM13 n=1 Tax=Cryptolaemus montrouzieri TaxID=559131 RepID=A0ABD2ML90_9CUCU